MINRVVLVGRITKDPLMRKTQNDTSVVTFILACNRHFPGQVQDADFISCVAWHKTADFMTQYVKKGALLGLEGRIQTRSYDDKDGKRVYVTEVLVEKLFLLESKKDKQASANQDAALDCASIPKASISESAKVEIPEEISGISTDDLPF